MIIKLYQWCKKHRLLCKIINCFFKLIFKMRKIMFLAELLHADQITLPQISLWLFCTLYFSSLLTHIKILYVYNIHVLRTFSGVLLELCKKVYYPTPTLQHTYVSSIFISHLYVNNFST